LAVNVYDGMFILDAGRYARDPEGISNQITKVIKDEGGEILVSRLWEERRLAYPIKGQRKGVYWLVYFRLEGEKLAAVRQKFRLSETILRFLLLRVDPRIVDTLVAHALAGPAALGAERRAAEARQREVEAAEGDDEVPAAGPGRRQALAASEEG
jgi:small subunit ribosomal protein S6